VQVGFSDEQLAAIDAWIARHDAPRPSREEAVRQLVAGRLGAYGPRTILPDEVTGRDVV
jgi:hypothetical protein